MSDNTYTCAHCGGTFEKGWSDEECQAEADAIWGKVDDPVLICDDCWQKTRPDRVPGDMGTLQMWLNARAAWRDYVDDRERRERARAMRAKESIPVRYRGRRKPSLAIQIDHALMDID